MASATAALALCSLLNGGQLVAQLRQAADGARFLEISLTGDHRQAMGDYRQATTLQRICDCLRLCCYDSYVNSCTGRTVFIHSVSVAINY